MLKKFGIDTEFFQIVLCCILFSKNDIYMFFFSKPAYVSREIIQNDFEVFFLANIIIIFFYYEAFGYNKVIKCERSEASKQ